MWVCGCGLQRFHLTDLHRIQKYIARREKDADVTRPLLTNIKMYFPISLINWFFLLLPSSHICSPVTVDRISLKTSL